MNAEDKAAHVLLERLDLFAVESPEADWGGVWRLARE